MPHAEAVGPADLRKLTEPGITKLFQPRIFERGRAYFEEGRVLRPVVYKNSIMAECRGTMPGNYQISIDISDNRFIASCTCPYVFGYCKHIAAVLYAWIKRPSSFKDLGNSERLLLNLPKEEIVEIIMDMTRYDPDVIYVINLRLTPVRDLPTFVSRELHNIFSDETVDYLTIREIVKKLEIFREYAADLFRSGRSDSGISVIDLVIEAVIANYTKVDDADRLMLNFFIVALELFGVMLPGISDEGMLRSLLTRTLDWYMDAEWGLENPLNEFIAYRSVKLHQSQYMMDVIELKRDDFKRSFMAAGWGSSEEYEYIDERIQRLSSLRSTIQAGSRGQ
ncbi:MAG TPA: SWIM zinc finger family protein [Methanocella sp.]|nr:SWIM zinc finger family protein [Methanocella sp.]